MAKLSRERRITYYLGMGMMALGFILFISVFFSFAGFMSNPQQLINGGGPLFTNAIIGMILMIAGSVVMNIGAKGAAGSGLLLDPEKAREDLKPFSEAAGGVINDAIGNIDIAKKFAGKGEEKEIIKIRCRNCGTLNDEDASFCKGCGKPL